MSSGDPAASWLEQEAAPAIRTGIATVARRPLAPDAVNQWPDAWQEAFQNAALQIWRSSAARTMAAEGRWEELRKFSHRAGHNAAIDVLRTMHGPAAGERYTEDAAEEGSAPLCSAPPDASPDSLLLRQDFRQELRCLLADMRAVVAALPQSAEHPSRQILGLYLQLLDQELKADPAPAPAPPDGPAPPAGVAPAAWNPATAMQRPQQDDRLHAAWVRLLLGDAGPLPTYREQRLDLQVSAILRPEHVAGEHATDETRRQAGQWVRTELSRARKRLRALYEERYHKALAW